MVTTVTKNSFFLFFFETMAPKPRMDSAAPAAGTKDNTYYIRSPRAPSHPPHQRGGSRELQYGVVVFHPKH